MAFQFPANPTLGIAMLALAGCSGMKLEGDCSYERTIATTYVCQPDGKIEHIRVGPPAAFD